MSPFRTGVRLLKRGLGAFGFELRRVRPASPSGARGYSNFGEDEIIRDLLGNLMTLWFFATPIIYPYTQAPERFRRLLDLNPFTHVAVAYQEVLYLDGQNRGGARLAVAGLVGVVALILGYAVFDRLR